MVSYVDLDRGMLPTSGSDSGGVSGAEGLSAAPSKEKKKVGRPISFRGDINSKDLTEAERRRIKRCAAGHPLHALWERLWPPCSRPACDDSSVIVSHQSWCVTCCLLIMPDAPLRFLVPNLPP